MRDLVERLVLCASGPTKSGRSHLPFLFPQPLYILNLDFGLEELLRKFPAHKVQVADHHVGKVATYAAYEAEYLSIKADWDAAIRAVAKEGGTVFMDTSTQLWQLIYTIRLHELRGRDPEKQNEEVRLEKALPFLYADANTAMDWFLTAPLAVPGVNAVFSDRYKPIYDNKGKVIPGEYERQGYGGMEARVPYAIELSYEPETDTRELKLTACRFDPRRQGWTMPVDEDFTYGSLVDFVMH